MGNRNIQHVFICGSKSIGQYGGFETFVDKLSEYMADEQGIKLHIACKANGNGFMDETKLVGASETIINSDGVEEFEYHNAHCFKLNIPEKIGPAQAIYYDVKSINYSIHYCKLNNIQKPIFYVLACRIGPFIRFLKRKIKKLGGVLYINPDGHEWKRAKWPGPVKKYWKFSERLMVKYSDLMICDSINIEKYIKSEYKKYKPETTYISYGAETIPSKLADDDPRFTEFLQRNSLGINQYYLVVGRFVPENNYETMIKEYMNCNSKRDFAIITNVNDKFLNELNDELDFKSDPRIKFVGTVYDVELLKKIRENAFGYLHGHEVGGTNPSLLEALGSTRINMLLDVGFNREVAKDTALYWSHADGNLSSLIDKVDTMSIEEAIPLGNKAIERIKTYYSWSLIANKYKDLWNESFSNS